MLTHDFDAQLKFDFCFSNIYEWIIDLAENLYGVKLKMVGDAISVLSENGVKLYVNT